MNTPSPFTPEALQLFLASLGGLSPEENKKAKELYLRNALTAYAAEKKKFKNFWISSALHLLIPVFWPMFFGARRDQKVQLEEMRARIQNAIRVWKDDLGSQAKELERELSQME